MPGFEPNSTSYVRAFPGYASFSLPFELFYYSEQSGNAVPSDATIDNVYQSLNETGLYAAAIYQDIFLELTLE